MGMLGGSYYKVKNPDPLTISVKSAAEVIAPLRQSKTMRLKFTNYFPTKSGTFR